MTTSRNPKVADKAAEILLAAYIEERIQARHHESQRHNLATILLGITTAILAVLGNFGFKETMLPLASFQIIVGVYGIFAVRKLYERSTLHYNRARGYRVKLENLYPNTEIASIRTTIMKKHNEKYPRLSKIGVVDFWIILFTIITILGIISFVMILSDF